jgi:hypothetical protein
MSPIYGGLITLQAGITLHEDEELDPCWPLEPCGATVKPVRNTVTWGGWLPGSWLTTVSGGIFPGDRYGFAGEFGKLVMNGSFEIWGGADLTGEFKFLDDVILYSNLDQWAAFGAVTHRFRGLDLESTLSLGRFYTASVFDFDANETETWENDPTIRLDFNRRMHEFEIGFFGVVNKHAEVIGLTLRIPLPVRRYLKPSILRPTTVPAFPFTYRDTVEPVGVSVSLFDDLNRLRKRLYPTFILNNVEDLRLANRYVGEEERP